MIYLDSAATTLQKPEAVSRAVLTAMSELASPGRGGHRPARLAAETVFRCRMAAADLFHAENPEQVVFTLNATHALNLAIKSLVRPGDEVVISGYEHNAVTRPLTALGCQLKLARGPLFQPEALLNAFDLLISPQTACVVCTHVSNVFGYLLPVGQVARLCRDRGVPLIVDASQAAGCILLDLTALGCAFLAMPGHKGLYGPQGTGILLCGDGPLPAPLLEGGTGSRSAVQSMPDFLPDRLEAGTHNVPGIAGLLAGLDYVRSRGEETMFRKEQGLIALCIRELEQIPGITVFAAQDPTLQAGVLSFRAEGQDCEDLAEALAERDIAVRAGLHCAPAAHCSAGTLDSGTVRVSVSDFNTADEILSFARQLRQLLA